LEGKSGGQGGDGPCPGGAFFKGFRVLQLVLGEDRKHLYQTAKKGLGGKQNSSFDLDDGRKKGRYRKAIQIGG